MSFFGRADHVLFLSAILWPYLWTASTIFQKLCLLLIHFVERKRTLHLLNKSYLHISKTFHSKRIFFQYLYRIRLEAILDRCIRYVVWWEFQATNFGLEFDAYKNDKNKIWLKVLEFPASLIEKKSYWTEGLCICLAFFFCFTTFKKPTLPQGVATCWVVDEAVANNFHSPAPCPHIQYVALLVCCCDPLSLPQEKRIFQPTFYTCRVSIPRRNCLQLLLLS